MKSIVTKGQEVTHLQNFSKMFKGEITVPVTNCINNGLQQSIRLSSHDLIIQKLAANGFDLQTVFNG